MPSKILPFLFIIVLAIISIPSVNGLNITIGNISINGTDTYYEANFSSVSIPTNKVPITDLFISNQDTGYQKDLPSISIPTNKVPITNLFISNQDTEYQKDLLSVSIPTNSVSITDIFIANQDADYHQGLSSVSIPTNSIPIQNIFISNADVIFKENLVPNQTTQLPIASFTYSPENPIANQTIIFDASNSTDPDGTITNYEWNFGDATTGFGKLTTHSYAENETYSINLIVTDNNGATSTTLKKIAIGTISAEEEYNPKVSVPTYAPFAEYGHEGTNLTFIIKVENKGTKKDTINLIANPDNPAGLDISLSKDSVTLSPSESELIYLNVSLKSESYNPITITATSEGDDTKVSSCEVKTGGSTSLNPLYFSFWFSNTDTKDHTLNFNAPTYLKLSEKSLILKPEEIKGFDTVFDPDSSQTDIREFYVEITDETSGETLKIPIKLSLGYNIIATDYDVSENGYNFSNYGKHIVIPNLIELGGRCYPMSETSTLYFIGAIELPKDVKSVYTMQEEKAKKVIDSYFWAHFLDNFKIGVHVGLDPINEQNEYQKLKDNLTKGEPMMLIMAKPSVIPGVHAHIHAVLAYKIIEIGDKAYVLIYENEIPYSITNFPIAFPCTVFNMTSGEFNYADSFTKFVVQKPNPYPKPDTTTLAIECPVNTTITNQYGRISDNGTNEILDVDMLITNETDIDYDIITSILTRPSC
jgi:hypothetical protein